MPLDHGLVFPGDRESGSPVRVADAVQKRLCYIQTMSLKVYDWRVSPSAGDRIGIKRCCHKQFLNGTTYQVVSALNMSWSCMESA